MNAAHVALLNRVAARLRALEALSATTLRSVRRELSRQLQGASGPEVIEVAAGLLDTRSPGAHVVAYELIRHHPEAPGAIRASDLRRLGKHLTTWGEVDTFACAVAGRAWRDGRVKDALIHEWAVSPDRWWRRAALVSTVPLNVKAQGGRGDTPRTLAVCSLLVDDRDDMVVKALSWALRALAVHDARAVSGFVEQNRERLAARVIREVRNKLETGLKSGSRRRRA